MSKNDHIPTYRRHRQSGQAIVTLTGGVGCRRDILLGKHGTKQSRAEYARVIAEWEANGRELVKKWGQAPANYRKSQGFGRDGRSQSPFFHKLRELPRCNAHASDGSIR